MKVYSKLGNAPTEETSLGTDEGVERYLSFLTSRFPFAASLMSVYSFEDKKEVLFSFSSENLDEEIYFFFISNNLPKTWEDTTEYMSCEAHLYWYQHRFENGEDEVEYA